MKSIKNHPNLYRTETSYYYRRRIPDDLRDIINSTECKKSLKGNFITAKRKAAFLNSALDQLCNIIRVMKPTGEDIKLIVRNYFEKLLMDAESQMWLDSEVWRGYQTEEHDGATPEDRITFFEEQLLELRNVARQQSYHEHYAELAREILEAKGYRFYEISPTTAQVCKGFAEAEMEAIRMVIAARKGEAENTDIRNPMFKDCHNFLIEPDIDLAIQNEGLPYYEKKQESPLLSETIKRHITFISARNYSGNTLKDIENTLNLMPETMGDKRLSAITKDDCRNFRDIIQKMPAHYGKKYKAKGIGLMAVINGDDPDYERLSQRSQHKYWMWTNSFFAWCVDEGYLSENPMGKIKVQASKASIEDRDPFSDEELKAFFQSPQYTGHKSDSRRADRGNEIIKDGKYWIPLVGLFSGMRLGEILQLQLSDIAYDGEIPYFNVNDEGDDKSLKTEQSRRIVPVHPELMKLGFIDMVEKKRKKKLTSPRLFDDTKVSATHGVSHEFSKYFSRYMKNIGLKRKRLVFHSFRHNFVQGMRDARIDQDRMDALDGRITGFKEGSNTRRNYGRAFTAKDLYPDICKISYGVDLSHLYKN